MVAVIRGRIWLDPQRAKFQRRCQPGRWIHRAGEPGPFWLHVARHALIGATAIAVAVSWLRK